MSLKKYLTTLKNPISKKREKKASYDELVTHNLKFVVKLASMYKGRYPFADLVQIGNMGLMKAASKYKPGSNTKLITYARHWILLYMKRAIKRDKFIMFDDMKHGIVSIEQDHGHGSHSGDHVNSGLSYGYFNVVSENQILMKMEHKLTDEVCDSPYDTLVKKERMGRLRNMGNVLTPQEMDIVCRRYGIDGHRCEKLRTLAKEYGISNQMISIIEKKALGKLRKMMSED